MNAHQWNIVLTVHDGRFGEAVRLLRSFGEVRRTEFHNVLLLQVEDPGQFLAALERMAGSDPELAKTVSRAVPVTHRFSFQSPEEFRAKACEVVNEWLPALGGRTFHVRMHRRGFKGRLSSQQEERFLDGYLLEHLALAGTPGRIDFDDPDVVIAVETLGPQAGMSYWTRDQRQSNPTFLKVD